MEALSMMVMDRSMEALNMVMEITMEPWCWRTL
jgi:hypothetical protein